MAPSLQHKLRWFAVIWLAWIAFGLFFFSQSVVQKVVSGEPTPWWHYLVSWMVGVSLWACITPGILWLGRRFPFTRQKWGRRLALHLLLAISITILQLAVESLILFHLGVFPTIMKTLPATFIFLLIIGFHNGIPTYGTILGIQYGINYYRRYQER